MDDGLAVEIDLQSAASWTVSRIRDLADARSSCYKAVAALADRLQPLSAFAATTERLGSQGRSKYAHRLPGCRNYTPQLA